MGTAGASANPKENNFYREPVGHGDGVRVRLAASNRKVNFSLK